MGWCNSNIAKQVRINQSASAETYGGVSFVVEKDLEFSEVLTVHEEGVISIYNSDNGSQIFGVRSCYPRQSSYYGKINVVRVLSILLRQTFPLVMQVIHTDVASNPITRTSFSITLNNLISNMVAAQNLKPGSQAILDGDLNNDVNSRGGTLLNIVLELYFIGLTEKVSIVVSATDSSIKAQIV